MRAYPAQPTLARFLSGWGTHRSVRSDGDSLDRSQATETSTEGHAANASTGANVPAATAAGGVGGESSTYIRETKGRSGILDNEDVSAAPANSSNQMAMVSGENLGKLMSTSNHPKGVDGIGEPASTGEGSGTDRRGSHVIMTAPRQDSITAPPLTQDPPPVPFRGTFWDEKDRSTESVDDVGGSNGAQRVDVSRIAPQPTQCQGLRLEESRADGGNGKGNLDSNTNGIKDDADFCRKNAAVQVTACR